MSDRSCLAIILAAGEGTRMKSSMTKVLHPVAHLPMVAHVVLAANQSGASSIALVIGRDGDKVRDVSAPFGKNVESFEQVERLGTAHAVLAARDAIARGFDDIIIMFGDTPLVRSQELSAARQRLAQGCDVVVMGFRTQDPTGYGRLLEENGQLVAIREEKEASINERKVTYCNGGLMAVSGAHALQLIDQIDNNNAKGEYYLTDIVEIAQKQGLNVVANEVGYESVLGVNNRAELAQAESLWQQRKRHEMLINGVSMPAPETVYFAYDTQIAVDSIIEPNVVFAPGVVLNGACRIRAFSHLEGAVLDDGCEIGPFARLRPGTQLAQGVKVGNFCEVKKAQVGQGSKINHLSYIGDANISDGVNIGAGTITCNYDGYNKSVTSIGTGAFIGSNSALIAPVTIGAGAYVASGSTLSDDVPDNALALARSRQVNIEDRATQMRATMRAKKEQQK